MHVCAHIVVRGLVQGVGFRYYVYSKAKALGCSGYVRNLENGDVEIFTEADRSLIEELIVQIRVGPRAAQVNDVMVQWQVASQKFASFEIR